MVNISTDGLTAEEALAFEQWQAFQLAVAKARMSLKCAYRDAWYRGESGPFPLLPTLYRERHHFAMLGKKSTAALQAVRKIDRDLLKLTQDRQAAGQQIAVAKKNRVSTKASKCTYREATTKVRVAEAEAQELRKEFDYQCKNELSLSPMLRREREMFEDYRVHSGHHHTSSWQTLTEMRHYGVSTRLLDWSPSQDVALFFALKRIRQIIIKERADDFPSAFACVKKYYHVDPATPLKELETAVELTARKRSSQAREEGSSQEHEPWCCETDSLCEWRKPRFWILNPYHCAKEEIHRRRELDGPAFQTIQTSPALEARIYEVSSDQRLDYYRSILCCDPGKEAWPFYWPIPIHTPWRSERLAAQQAVFIVYGTTVLPMEEIYSAKAITYVNINIAAAIYGVLYLRAQRIDSFTIFRDLDSLGKRIVELYG